MRKCRVTKHITYQGEGEGEEVHNYGKPQIFLLLANLTPIWKSRTLS